MMSPALARRAAELAQEAIPFVSATVVRAQHPTSAQAGDTAIVLGDGTIEGFVGGVCAEHSVRVKSLTAIETGEPVLLRILPDGADRDPDAIGGRSRDGDGPTSHGGGFTGDGDGGRDGAVTVRNTCLSGGAIEVFLEPVLSPPRVLIQGETPIAGAVRRIGPELGLELVAIHRGTPAPASGDLALVVAAHGRDDLHALRRALEAGVPYVGLVASPQRGAGVIAELRADGVPDDLLELIDTPAGIEIGALTAAEIAISILARVVAVRRGGWTGREAGRASAPGQSSGAGEASAPAATDALGKAGAGGRVSSPAPASPTNAVDPICGMTVATGPGTPSLEYEGETVYFCREGCKAEFLSQHEHAVTGAE